MKRFIIAALCMVLATSTVGCTYNEMYGNSVDKVTDATTSTEPTMGHEQVLIDNDVIKVTFHKVYELSYLKGYCYMEMTLENKSDNEIRVYPSEAYVNDVAITLIGGTNGLKSGKTSVDPFYFPYTNYGLEGIHDIKTIEFNLSIYNGTWEENTKTDTFVINFGENTEEVS